MSDYENQMKLMLEPSSLKGAGAFEPKLTFVERCAVLALDKVGAKRALIAAAFKIARPTVAYICNPASRYYKSVRKEFADLGRDAFMKQYLTEEMIERVNRAKDDLAAKASDAEHAELRRFEGTVNGPNRAYKKKEGDHTLWEPNTSVLYAFSVVWLDALPNGTFDESGQFTSPGWYITETVGEYKKRGYSIPAEGGYNTFLFPFWGDPGPRLTSSDAYKEYKAALALEELDE